MSNKKRKIVGDEIAQALKARELEDPEGDPDAVTKFGTIDDEDLDFSSLGQISNFRRRNVEDLTKTNARYAGVKVSRAELEREFEQSGSEESESEEV